MFIKSQFVLVRNEGKRNDGKKGGKYEEKEKYSGQMESV